MLCVNCGKEVPFGGRVCPWCHADNSRSHASHLFSRVLGFIGAAVGAGIGYMIDEEMGWLVGGVIGMIIGAVIGFSKGMSTHRNVKCPNCGTMLRVDTTQGPNYQCFKCQEMFHLT